MAFEAFEEGLEEDLEEFEEGLEGFEEDLEGFEEDLEGFEEGLEGFEEGCLGGLARVDLEEGVSIRSDGCSDSFSARAIGCWGSDSGRISAARRSS